MDEELSLLYMNPSMFEPLFDCGPLVSFQGHAQWYCASRVGGWTWSCLWGCKGWIGGKLVTTNYWYLQCRGTPVCVWIIQNQPNRKEKHGGKISESQPSFLTETAICIVERWKKSMGYRFVLECSHTQESRTCSFFSTTVCWGPEILLPWQRDVTTSSLYWRIKDRV